ncbi:40S ribosomal protein S8-like [Microtus oregoni]|uniref:40S ribosomal protein S8-like n=1 Tax=Microtus oregoni TaxID=111838 RepID=UPI001BB2D095|nr:40S ribosomal protein S8-like [Microtus oregoni]
MALADAGHPTGGCFLSPGSWIFAFGLFSKLFYNASNNELVRTKTLVKNCIVLIDSTPYRQWYESHYALPLGRKKGAKLTPEEEEILNKKRSKKIQKKYDERKKNAKISSLLEEQFQQGKLLACIASRPGQCGRADGYVLEGRELAFYLRKIKARKANKPSIIAHVLKVFIIL